MVRLVAGGLLFYALQRHRYSYYTILRWVTCFASLYPAYIAFKTKKTSWIWLLSAIGLLFNPLIPIALDRGAWAVIDIGTGILLLASIFFVQEADGK